MSNPIIGWKHAAALPDTAAERVMIIEDEARLRASTALLLSRPNRDIVECGNGHEALALIRQRDVDIVLLDLHLPDMHGLEVLQRLREMPSAAVVIVVSADHQINSAIQALRLGAYEFVRKPFEPEQLERTVDNALHRRRLEQSHAMMTARLEQSENLHRFLVEQSPDIIYTLDEAGRFLFINGRIESMLGFSRQDLIGEHFSILIHDDDREQASFAFGERRTGERASHNVEVRLRRNDNNGYVHFDNRLIVTMLTATGLYENAEPGQPGRFIGTYGVARDVTEHKRAEQVISFHAFHDHLTGLPNRTLFRDRLEVAIRQAKRRESLVGIVFIDLDRFKLVNDTYGHAEGDQLLKNVTERLTGILRSSDTLARQGGDEFTVLLPDLPRREDAGITADKIVAAMATPFAVAGQEFIASVSLGIALCPNDGETPESLIRHADLAMYHIKESGKNGWAFYTPEMSQGHWDRIALENDLRQAAERGQLVLAYQPQISAARQRMVGVEALLRWQHPDHGLLDPSRFISLAEEAGFIKSLSDWVLAESCRQLARWHREGHAGLRMSINLSPHEFERDDLVDRVIRNLVANRLPTHLFEVEITENILLQDAERVIDKVRTLRRHGVQVAIDDFGTRYSSLNYLRRFPVSSIKIDQSFTHSLEHDDGGASIVKAFVGIAEGFDLHLVAEGVETEVQQKALQRLGCDVMQGYHFARPSSPDQIKTLLETYPSA